MITLESLYSFFTSKYIIAYLVLHLFSILFAHYSLKKLKKQDPSLAKKYAVFERTDYDKISYVKGILSKYL